MVNFCVHIKPRIIITEMLPSGIVNPCITLLYLWGGGIRAYKSPVHFMWTTPQNSRVPSYQWAAILAALEEHGDSGTT